MTSFDETVFKTYSLKTMSVSDSTQFNEMNKLLQELKDLHAPDRCEGPFNFVWHGMQRLTHFGSSGKTDQQKITDYWNAKQESSGVQQKDELKTLASISLHDFYFVCRELDQVRTVAFFRSHQKIWQLTNGETQAELAIKNNDLYKFIDDSSPSNVQKMFDIMIAQWAWRDRMLTAWEIH